MSEFELPPHIAAMMQQQMQAMTPQPRFTAAEQAQIDAYERACGEEQVRERQAFLDWAGLFCTCDRWYDRELVGEKPAPQVGCQIHAMVSWNPFTKDWFW